MNTGKGKVVRYAFLMLMLLFIYLPILILAVYSFTSATQIGAIRGFSMKNYVTLFTTPELRNMIAGTLALAVGSAVIATSLGTLGAIGAFYSKTSVSSMISTLNQATIKKIVVGSMYHDQTSDLHNEFLRSVSPLYYQG